MRRTRPFAAHAAFPGPPPTRTHLPACPRLPAWLQWQVAPQRGIAQPYNVYDAFRF